MKNSNIVFIISASLLIGIGFYIQQEEEKEKAPESLLTVMREQAKQAFFSTGTASNSFTKEWESIYLEQYNHLTGCRKYYGLINDKDNALLCRVKQRNLIEEAKLQLGIQFNPDRPMTQYDIFYGLDSMDGAYVSQASAEHYKSNGLLSVDIATGGKKLSVYAMDCNLQMCEWDVSSDYNDGKGHIVVLTNEEKNMQFRYGHTLLTTDKKKVVTGDEVGIILCPDDEGAGITTGCHLDFSFWVQTNGNWTQAEYKDDLSVSIEDIIDTKLKATSKNKEGLAYFTTYNGECNQTKGGVIGEDGNCYGTKTAPCAVGKNAGNTSGLCGSPVSTATGANLKELYEKGENPIALTRDLIEGDPSTGYCSKDCPFKFWDKVLVSPVDNWQQPYTAILVDAKAKRFKNGGDQFHLDRKNNNSYMATIKKL